MIRVRWKGGEAVKRKVCMLAFAAYCVLMACLLFGRERCDWQQAVANVNLVPFQTIERYVRLLTGDYSDHLRWHAVVNLVGNVVMFLPLGFLPPILWKKFRPLWRCLLRGTAIIILVELVQLFALVGSCDVDDLLLNVIGIALGYGVYRLFSTKRRRK